MSINGNRRKYKLSLKNINIKLILFGFYVFMIIGNSYAISNSVIAANDYKFILDNLRRMDVMIKNFPDPERKDLYSKIEMEFQNASEELYALRYDSAHIKFLKIKNDIINLLDLISINYIERSEKILTEISVKSFKILIEYGRGGSKAAHFRKPYDPIKGIKSYDEKNYHFFVDKETIERYMKNGFRLLQFAKNSYDDPEIKTLRRKKHILNKSRDTIIKNYLKIIKLCRESKKSGLETFKILNEDKFLDIVKEYKIDNSIILPIYDLRIPDEYRRDANDCINLLHSIEEKKITEKK